METKVSIILPSLNVVNYIKECLESVIHQSLKEIEIICVDAGSTDGTYEIIQRYSNLDSRIKVLTSDKKSYGQQVNMGIEKATGQYVAIVETDDFIDCQMYQYLYDIAERNELDFIKGDYAAFYRNNEGQYSFETIPMFYNDKHLYNKIINAIEYPQLHILGLNIWRGIYKKDFLIKCNIILNETKGAAFQDTSFHHQVLAYAKRVMYVDKPFYKYRSDRLESSFRNADTLKYTYNEYQRVLDGNILPKDIDNYQLRYIYGKCGREVYKHFLNNLDKGGQLYEDSSEVWVYMRWFQTKFLWAFNNEIICKEDFSMQEWFFIRFLMESYSAFLIYYKLRVQLMKEADTSLLNKIRNKKVIIFGCGNYGSKVYQLLKKEKICIDGFCDNDSSKWNLDVGESKVYEPSKCFKYFQEDDYVIANEKFSEIIKQQLISEGVAIDKIHRYGN